VDDRVSQLLCIQPGEYVIEHLPRHGPPSGADWLALVRAPEGLTVVRHPVGPEEPAGGRWGAFYSGQADHGLDVPGMLASVVNPLARAAIPVFVTSTYRADLVFVPAGRRHEAAEVLRQAGHVVEDAG
jgi:uncharacterized protein